MRLRGKTLFLALLVLGLIGGGEKATSSMRDPQLEFDFPKLRAGNYSIQSPEDESYNCVAFAVGNEMRVWQWMPRPTGGYYWQAFSETNMEPLRSLCLDPTEARSSHFGFGFVPFWRE